MSAMTPTEDMMSSDDSDEDNYNYLTALDNINWNYNNRDNNRDNNTDHYHSDDHLEDTKDMAKSSVKGVVRPAVAVKSKSNRNDGLLKDMIASEKSEKDKPKEVSKNGFHNKRDFEESEEELNEMLVIKDNDIECETKSGNNYTIPKNKRQKANNINESEYSVEEVLNQKKANHEKSVKNQTKSDVNRLKNERVFGKAFSPTVYSPEVPVMRPQVPTSSGHNRSMTLNEDNCSESKYSPKAILSVILDWNTKWLSECTPNEVPPPLSPFGEGLGVKTCYESLDEYQSAYVPLILFETWAQIYEDFQKTKRSQSNAFRAMLLPDYSSDEYFITICFQTVVPKNKAKSHNSASEGHLVLIELSIDFSATNEQKKIVLFGYVSECVVENITPNTSLPPGVLASPHNSLLVRYTALLSKRPIRLRTTEAISVRTVHYLKPTLRQIELISGLNTCPLFKDILKPRSFTCQVVVPSNVSLNTVNFNESQNRAILGSTEALNRPYAVPKILFIQGPPGTGKTHTLIGILKHIYMKWDSDSTGCLPRILICAPSNGAVDEIARRLYRERRFLQKHKQNRALRCVRIGQTSQIHPDVRQISLDKLIEDNAENEEKKFLALKQKQSEEWQQKVSKLDQEIADLRAAANRKTELSQANAEMQRLMADNYKFSAKSKPLESKNRLKIEIMVKADVVLTTLNSSHQQSIENLFRNYGSKTFDCVIVDEASQCSEPELLMPLAYKMTKMILIGDPMQLPATVISKKASSLQFGRSLFERFFQYFGECQQKDPKQKSPILMLTEQYRMHPQICQFPSLRFYDGRLTTSEKVVQNRDFAIKPYIVFDVTDTQESRTDPTNKYNELEANFVVRLLTIIDCVFGSATQSGRKVSVGVITPYNGQKNFLNKKVEDMHFKVNVEVNTVDGFQGQERDVIILSCVRAFDNQNPNHSNSIGFLNSVQRMNVSLTRAKYSMIVCISGRSLQNDNNWKALIDNSMKRPNCKFKVPSTVGEDKLTKMITKVEIIDVCE